MATRIEKSNDLMSTRLRYIENRTKELEKLLSDQAFERGASGPGRPANLTDQLPDAGFVPQQSATDDSQQEIPRYSVPRSDDEEAEAQRRDDRTQRLIRDGRPAGKTRLTRPRMITLGAVVLLVVIIIAKLLFFGSGASWPASVAAVKADIAKACQNPDVVSEPGQVNFACGKDTQQVLWVLSLLTSRDDPKFTSKVTGREGLEPITPSQGGTIAWSLNLHAPYDPMNPIDSVEVAARAINNIVGGATVVGSNGKTEVEPGLESSSSNCARYTGSPAVISRAGYPSMCALPVTSTSGQAALVTDIYQQWVVGASSVAAQDAGVLFENSNDPGNSQVQAILSNPPASGL
jgi:hypothetical protein